METKQREGDRQACRGRKGKTEVEIEKACWRPERRAYEVFGP